MKSMTEAEAASDFPAVLDEVERGETVLVTREGTPVARLVPEEKTIAARIAEVFEKYPADPEFADHLEEVMHDLRSQPDREQEQG
jgi:prevent-host-death family protein